MLLEVDAKDFHTNSILRIINRLTDGSRRKIAKAVVLVPAIKYINSMKLDSALKLNFPLAIIVILLSNGCSSSADKFVENLRN